MNLSLRCRICRNEENNKVLIAKERMFGLGAEFEYIECGLCGCLQIKEYLQDPAPYYPGDYYSVNVDRSYGLIRAIKAFRNRMSYQPVGFLGVMVNRFIPENRYQSLRDLRKNKSQSILDIGCGSGEMLKSLQRWGFSNLHGVDPFIEKDVVYDGVVKICKKTTQEISGKYDFIMMHHSFEHMQNPAEVLTTLRSHLTDDGTILIRIPVGRSFAYETYKSNWVQLDAPRHLYLHTTESMQVMCSNVGLEIVNVHFDSMPFQFWGSEMYKDKIPLISNSGKNRIRYFIKYRLFNNYAAKSRKLNREQRGDQAAFYIKKRI